jgi:3-keto-5-aminohexanoate cleavage enzyme
MEPVEMDKAVVTCALTGVLTDPAVYPAPVTPEQMAREARRACDEGASVVHVHFRRLEPGKGQLPSWEPEVATAVVAAIRDACPGVIVNQTTGVVGPDIAGPIACLNAVRPEIAALNAGSLNYLKTRGDGTWAWPPMLFDNPVEKVAAFLTTMGECAIEPEFECFDTGIVRTAAAIARNCGYARAPKCNFVMGVESGMPADPDLLPILIRLIVAGARWSVTAIGRREIWPLHRRAAELGGDLRTGLEDTIYLPDGSRAASNGELVEALAAVAREAGRAIASPEEARLALNLSPKVKETGP